MRIRTLIAAAAVGAALVAVPSGAQAAARVNATNEFGKTQADTTYATKLTVRGSGFQSIKGGHGGIYVFFGTVKAGWRPSKGGQTGADYLYVPDSEAKSNSGFQKFVAFPGGDTSSSANGGTIKADGTWSTTITVPGATFKAADRNGKVVTVDCAKVTCGVITVGAHGVKNARNETFTKVSFATIYGASPTTPSPTAAPADGAAPEAAPATPAPVTVKAADATAAVDTSTAVIGRVLSFSGAGFSPGEQVVATLDDGRAAVGPLTAGSSGEIAGVLQLPAGTRAGTHVLKLTGAASGASPTVNFPIANDPELLAASSTDDSTDWAPTVFVALAAVVLLGALAFAFARVRRIRRARAATEVGHVG